MIEYPEGPIRMPKQEVAEGQKHGYIGAVETYEPPKEGSTNVIPDLATAERRVSAAKYALKGAEADLATAKAAHDKDRADAPSRDTGKDK